MELREKIGERHSVGFGYGTVWRFLARIGSRARRRRATRRSRKEMMSPKRASSGRGTARSRSLKLVFIDETAVSTTWRVLRLDAARRALSDVRPVWALKQDARRGAAVDRIDAPMTIDGALDGRRSWPMSSRFWRRRFLLAKRAVGQCATHKVAVRGKPSRRRAQAYLLPPYSPTSIDREAFLQDQVDLQRIAARTVEALEAAVGGPLQSFTPQECMKLLLPHRLRLQLDR